MKILIVDDEPLVRKSLGRACRAKGHEVTEAVDGKDGFEKWLEIKPDLVFLDVLMPEMSGPEVLQNLREKKGPPAKVILMSAYSGEHNIATAQQMGADLFIPKPFEDVFQVVARADQLYSSGKTDA